MENKEEFFGKEHAESYDKRWEQLGAITDALHLLMTVNLQNLPIDSEILCVGAGTGKELIALGSRFPNWKFTALDSSAAMIDVCQTKVEKADFSARCDFHVGYLDSLPKNRMYNAATSILVSQFLTDVEQRIGFFKQIKEHLKPESYLISADLAIPDRSYSFESLQEAWAKMLMYTGLSEEKSRASTSQWGKAVAVVAPKEIEKVITSGGFENPILFYQALFIHAWYAKVSL